MTFHTPTFGRGPTRTRKLLSIAAVAWALKQTDLDPATKFVLVILADHANDDGICWPGQKGIAEKVGTKERQVRRHIAKLLAKGKIKTERLTNSGGGNS